MPVRIQKVKQQTTKMGTPLGAALRAAFAAAADSSKAAAMEAYMKHKQKCQGLSSVPRKAAQAAVFSAHEGALKDKVVWSAAIRDLWAGPWREERYAAIDLLDYGARKKLGHITPENLPVMLDLLAGCDHWDTLDALATKSLGAALKQLPRDEFRTHVRAFNANADHLWMRRAAMLVQLKFKKDTDTELLAEVVLSRAHEKDFFIKKAIGWALREYAKTDRKWVREFVAAHSDALSSLSKKEALKHG